MQKSRVSRYNCYPRDRDLGFGEGGNLLHKPLFFHEGLTLANGFLQNGSFRSGIAAAFVDGGEQIEKV